MRKKYHVLCRVCVVCVSLLTLPTVSNAAENTLWSNFSEIEELHRADEMNARTINYAGRTLGIAPILREQLTEKPNNPPMFLFADTIEGEVDSEVFLKGNAQIRQFGSILKADSIHYNQITTDISAEGNVKILQNGNWIRGTGFKVNQSTQEGVFHEPVFDLAINNGTAKGSELYFMGPNLYRLTDAVYSGCSCIEPAWEVKADELELDYNTGRGVGKNGVLYFKEVPILASPYLFFPLTQERMSGVLAPTFSVTSKGGVDFTLPYYFNIAPNRDLTLYPRLVQRRGAMIGAEFRYLEPWFSGTLYGEVLPQDRRSDKNNRFFVKSTQQFNLSDNLRFAWDVSNVSDDAYFRDLGQSAAGQSVPTTLTRNFELTYTQPHWLTSLRFNDFKVLQDPAAPIDSPYRREPQLRSAGAYFDVAGFDIRMVNEYTKFAHDSKVSGERMYAYPSISYPVVFPGGYITPKLGVHASYYDIDSFTNASNAYQPGYHTSRTVPLFSLDAGLTFQRDTMFFGNSATQTLEPRMYYLRVPYREQSNIPIFDTVATDFSFAQIFSENLFAGWDRIADADQITTALTSRWIDDATGLERARVGVAQRTYFSEQRVTLPNQKGRTQNRSDYLFSVYGGLLQGLSAEMTVQYNPYDKTADKAVVSGVWAPNKNATASLSYRYEREGVRLLEEQKLVEAAFQWPLTSNLFGVGRLQYSLVEDRVVQGVFGVEYKSTCCWNLRMVAQHYAVAKQETTTAYFLQLELTGLARIGSNPIDVLRASIPGYQLINDPIPSRSAYERYE